MWRFILFISLVSSLFHGGFSEVVDCFDQKEFCECSNENGNKDKDVCEFKLEIEELQTFTSYVITENNDLLTRGTPGDTYYLDATGYHPAGNNLERRCYINAPLVNDEDFKQRNCSIPMTVDGVSYRRYIAVNGRIPGPTLIVTEDQLVKVTVVNRLTSEAITIHWHGMHQKGTPWMDGVGFISQYPIGPGETFDYIFKATPAGTHWYHSHVGAQRTDGLFGALVVRENNNFFRDVVAPNVSSRTGTGQDIPSRYTLTLLDWQREASLDLFVKIHSTLEFYPDKPIGQVPTNRDSPYNPRTISPDGVEVGPVPYWSGLINGRGRMDNSIRTPLSIFNVSRNSTYRFRIIGAQSLYAYKFSIDSHKLHVIATDGHFIEPVKVDYIIVHSGERYDFILETYDDDSNGNAFWIRAMTLETQQDREHSARAILTYETSPIRTTDWTNAYSGVNSLDHNCNSARPCDVLNCPFREYRGNTYQTCIHLTNLTPSPPSPIPDSKLPKFDATYTPNFFNFGFEGDSFTSAINGKNFQFPVVAYQTSCGQYDRDQADSEINTCLMCSNVSPMDCKCINVVPIANKEKFTTEEEPETVIMVLSAVGNMSSGLNNFSHPIHLHGHSFHVLYIGHGEYNEEGKLIANSPDVDCGDFLCMNPTWNNDTMPMDVLREVTRDGGRINNTAILKDTVIVPAGGYVVIAFQADNPGYWFLHCHIEVHQLEGMGVMIEEYPSDQHPKPPSEINNQGHFRWNANNYNEHVMKAETCSSESGSRKITVTVSLLSVCVYISTIL